MTRSLAAAALAAVALTTPLLLPAPAHADHTLCSNGDGGETPDPLDLGVGIDYDEANAIYVCAGDLLVVARTNGAPPTVCLADDPSHPTSGFCI